MKDTDSYLKIGFYVISIIPLLIRFFANFKKEENSISNYRRNLLIQIRVLLSTDHTNSIRFDESEVMIDEDFYTKLQSKFNDFLYTETNKLDDFYKANRLARIAIKWIRYLKYLLVISSTILIVVFSIALYIQRNNINILTWYIYLAIVAFFILITVIIKECYVDSFSNLCIKYEIERKE